jgi:MHS family citrate/tricarballylate:H+ symporter-like MFS transporter
MTAGSLDRAELGQAAAQGLSLTRIFAVAIGNALEFYDFLTFSLFAVQIGHCFFPEEQTKHGLLFTLATFGTGFATRPLGGIVIGFFGDRAGRKPAMILSFLLMGAAIMGLVLTPTYASIGFAAPVLLVLFRLLQGFALGGEVGPSTAFLVEAAPAHRRAFYVAFQAATQSLAIVLAGLIGLILSTQLDPALLDAWGWRIAFLAGAAIIPVGLLIRRTLPETLHAVEHAPKPAGGQRVSIRLVVASMLILCAGTIGSYTLIYMTTYAQDSLHLSPVEAFGITTVIGVCAIAGGLSGGLLADRIGRRPVMLISAGTLVVMTIPIFFGMSRYPGVATVYGGAALLALLHGLLSPPLLSTLSESLPRAARSGVFGTVYAVTIATFGGSAQYVMKQLAEVVGATSFTTDWLGDLGSSRMVPGWYLTTALLLGLIGIALIRESAPVKTAALEEAPTLL